MPSKAYYYCLNTGDLTEVQGITYSSHLFLECPCDVCRKNREILENAEIQEEDN